MWFLTTMAKMMMARTIGTGMLQQQQLGGDSDDPDIWNKGVMQKQQLGGELQKSGGVLDTIDSSGYVSGGDAGSGGGPRSWTFLGIARPFDRGKSSRFCW